MLARNATMVAEIRYSDVLAVLTSWDKLERVNNYQQKAGDIIIRRFFEIEPTASEQMATNPKFTMHATKTVSMIGAVMSFL